MLPPSSSFSSIIYGVGTIMKSVCWMFCSVAPSSLSLSLSLSSFSHSLSFFLFLSLSLKQKDNTTFDAGIWQMILLQKEKNLFSLFSLQRLFVLQQNAAALNGGVIFGRQWTMEKRVCLESLGRACGQYYKCSMNVYCNARKVNYLAEWL